MKRVLFFFVVGLSITMLSCKSRYGCPSSGKNVGAEKVLSGDAKTMKALKRAPKFKS